MSKDYPTKEKAKKMLHEGMANGKPLSKKQRGLFGILASGHKPMMSKMAKKMKSHMA